MRCLDGITESMDMSFSTLWKLVEDRGAWHVMYGPWSHKEWDLTQQLNNNNKTLHKAFSKVPVSKGTYKLDPQGEKKSL